MFQVPHTERLITQLLSSPEAQKLIQSVKLSQNAEYAEGLGPESTSGSLQNVDKVIPREDVLVTAKTLLEECQQLTCRSSDATLAMQGLADQGATLLQVHRCVLAARCVFFQALFSTIWTEPTAEHVTISTEVCSGEQAIAVVRYIYTGSIDVDISTAAEVISLANLWQLPDLISLVIQQLIEGTCQSFRRPSGPSDSLVADVPAMAAFAKAALDGGIEHDAATALYQSCMTWLAKHALLAWATKVYAQLPAKIRQDVRAKARALLSAVSALPQLEQADKLITRLSPAKWAADMHTAAKAWRAEVLQYIAESLPKVALTSAFVERLQSEWSLEHLQQIAEAVKAEYGASRAGYALEVYLSLQRLQAAAANDSFTEAEAVKETLDGLKDHCWSYILRNWHLLQRTPTYKSTLPSDQRQRLALDVQEGLSHITTLESPGDQSQSMGFSVLWDASNTQPKSSASALTPDGKRPVSKATEKRRQRQAEEEERQRQAEERKMLQQRRQQTVKEIKERQVEARRRGDDAAAAAAQAKSSAQSASSMPEISEKADAARSSSLASPLQQSSQRKAGPRPTSQEVSQQKAGQGPSSQSGAQQQAKRRVSSQPGAEQRAGPVAESQQAALPKSNSSSSAGSYLRAGKRAAAPQGRWQNSGQIAERQQALDPAVKSRKDSAAVAVNSRPGSSRSTQDAKERLEVPSKLDLQPHSHRPASSQANCEAGVSRLQSRASPGNDRTSLRASGTKSRAEQAVIGDQSCHNRETSDRNSKPDSHQPAVRQSLQHLKRLSLTRNS